MFKTLTPYLLPLLLVGASFLPVQAQAVDDMIIPGQPAPRPSGVTADSTESTLPYPEVYLPPATTVWLNGTLGWGSTESLDFYFGAADNVSHLHYTIAVALQFRLASVLSMSVNFGQAVTHTSFDIDTEGLTFEDYTQRYRTSDREDFEDGMVRLTDGAMMVGMALHIVSSERDLFAGELSGGFDARFQGREDGLNWTAMLAARYQPASALRVRLGGVYVHERFSAMLSIGVAP